jgi:hypothetical protein
LLVENHAAEVITRKCLLAHVSLKLASILIAMLQMLLLLLMIFEPGSANDTIISIITTCFDLARLQATLNRRSGQGKIAARLVPNMLHTYEKQLQLFFIICV